MRFTPWIRPGLPAAALAIGLASLLACEQSGGNQLAEAVPANSTPADPSTRLAGREASASFLALMLDAHEKTRYQGVRRYEHHSTVGGLPQHLVYREQVSCDGAGAYAVDPLDLIEPQVSQSQEDLFLLLQRARTGLMFRYRDFRVRDLDAFVASYVAIDSGFPVQVVGRACAELLVQAQVTPDRRWLVHVDLENGLVLRAREEALDGTLVSLSEFESLSLTPDLSAVAFHQSQFGEQSLVPGSLQASQSLGFVPQEPKLLPAGWERIEFAKLVDPTDVNRPWAKFVYSDGVELLFYLQAKGNLPPPQVAPGPGVPVGPDVVRTLAVGAWNLTQGRVHGRDLVVMGRVAETVLYDLIQSSF